MPVKALIVDDEAAARSELRFALEQYPEVEVVGESANSEEAFKLLESLDYDLVFLDIDMPGLSGVELAQKINILPHHPVIIFVTAYGEFALDAFEVNALDYLLKPFSEDRFEQTMEKILGVIPGNGAHKKNDHNNINGKEHKEIAKVPVQKAGKTYLINRGDIIYVHAHGDYTYVFTSDNKYFCNFTLSEFEVRVHNRDFFRVHRSYIVNVNNIEYISHQPGGNYILKMNDANSSEVPVSRRQGKKLKALLGL